MQNLLHVRENNTPYSGNDKITSEPLSWGKAWDGSGIQISEMLKYKLLLSDCTSGKEIEQSILSKISLFGSSLPNVSEFLLSNLMPAK